ncbi:MAG: radical SAM protein [Proteobacteria bacterium]|nr:radical SAM protein [Pseudomonadota bacterium]
MSQVDLLLLNISNLPWRPIYPYAFIQVSEIARRFDLRVQRLDLLDVRRELWKSLLRRLVAVHRPRMIGLHLRQVDSIAHSDYYDSKTGRAGGTYFPVSDSRDLVRMLREVSSAPIVVGGFGFTTHPQMLFDYLEVDYGVQGDPDGFFAHFDDVVSSRLLHAVPGLMYRNLGALQANQRGYYPPAHEREYTEEIVDEMIRFYGHAQLYGPNPPTVAVEVMRGCPFRCYFCSEPDVKGRRIDYRDLDVIVDEMRFLLEHQIRRFWLVCSELNIKGHEFSLTIAEEIVKLNEAYPGSPIEWSAYSLPTTAESDLKVLQRSGYAGALNDILSLDDSNLRRAGVPYRTQKALPFLRAMAALHEERQQVESHYREDEQLKNRLATRTPKELGNLFSLFLGNAHVDVTTIRNTLRAVDESGLKEHYRAAHIIANTRVFATHRGGYNCPVQSDKEIISYDHHGRRPTDLRWPSFYYPRFLVDRLGSPAAIHEFFSFIADTFLSIAHRSKKDWNSFLLRHTNPGQVANWLSAVSLSSASTGREAAAAAVLARLLRDRDEADVSRLFVPESSERTLWNRVAERVLWLIFAAHRDETGAVLDFLSVPRDSETHIELSEYRFMEKLYADYESTGALVEAARRRGGFAPESLEYLYLSWLLYANNVCIRPDYRDLLFDPP